ncbi:MAG TPA: winged helix-turn-helix domain-containing protein [Streptosporangiaceae bacterium]|jgi:GntR family transcriptional regulator|nr:winged helix-turn-helix domain-containing protein [Streptosporangiaceae bacterium]
MAKAHELPSERVARDLRERIQRGEFSSGDPLPPVTELAESYGVARATVAKALRVLVDDGLVVTRPRWGTFVA